MAGGRLRLKSRVRLTLEGGRTSGANLASGYSGRMGMMLSWSALVGHGEP